MEVFLPQHPQRKTLGQQNCCFSEKGSLRAFLAFVYRSLGVFPRIRVPESTIDLQGNVPIRNVEIHNSTETPSGISDSVLGGMGDTPIREEFSHFHFKPGNSWNTTFRNGFGDTQRYLLPGFLAGMVQACGFSFRISLSHAFRLGCPSFLRNVIWLGHNTCDNAHLSGFVMTFWGAQKHASFRPCLHGRGSDNRSPTNTTRLGYTFDSRPSPKCIRTLTGTCCLPSMLETPGVG